MPGGAVAEAAKPLNMDVEKLSASGTQAGGIRQVFDSSAEFKK